MTSTVEALERELAEAQESRERYRKAVLRAESAYHAACGQRDEAWREESGELDELSRLVFRRRRELYTLTDDLKSAEARERRVKSRLMYVLPSERRRYLSVREDKELQGFLAAVSRSHTGDGATLQIRVVTEPAGELDLSGDATWRALQRLYSNTTRSWVLIEGDDRHAARAAAGCISHYLGGHLPRIFVGEVEITHPPSRHGWREPAGYEGSEGEEKLARLTVRSYLDGRTINRLAKRPEAISQIAAIARTCQSVNLTADEIRWRLEQVISLRPPVLEEVRHLAARHRHFSFYEISRAARLLDGHFEAEHSAARELHEAARRASEEGLPLVESAYASITSWSGSTLHQGR